MQQLAQKAVGHGSTGDTENGWHTTLRHIEGTEQKIEERERWGEVLIPSLIGVGMMPAMEHGAGDNVTKRPECPVQIGMHQEAKKRIEGHQRYDCSWIKASQTDDDVDQCRVQDEVDRMHPHRCEPVDLFRGVVDAMEPPKRLPVKQPVTPVLHQISDEQDDGCLYQDR